MESRLYLTPAGPEHKEAVWNYRSEFLETGEPLCGSALLDKAHSYEEWLAMNIKNRRQETALPGLVEATTYLAFLKETGELVGMIDFRHALNDYLRQYGGHIGYSVRKSRRRQGYGSEMLGLCLAECRAYGLERVLITCNKNNLASAAAIRAAGGVLENEVPHEGSLTQRYWVTLTEKQ